MDCKRRIIAHRNGGLMIRLLSAVLAGHGRILYNAPQTIEDGIPALRKAGPLERIRLCWEGFQTGMGQLYAGTVAFGEKLKFHGGEPGKIIIFPGVT
jgi:hypothetical protein